MVNKLATIRHRKDRASEDYSGSLRAAVAELRKENPMWSLQTIGTVIGVSRERVRQLLKAEGLPTAAVKQLNVVHLTCSNCGETFERLSRLHEYNQGRGFVETYCGTACHRLALGQMQRDGNGKLTECRNHHPMVADNVVLIPSRRTPNTTLRRCRTCRNEYARDYYHRKRGEVASDDNGTE